MDDCEKMFAEEMIAMYKEAHMNEYKEPAKEEPLAVLADRKGWEIAQLKHLSPFPNVWEICLRPKGGQRGEWVGENWPDFDTYAAAESKARAYLEGLDDVKGEGK